MKKIVISLLLLLCGILSIKSDIIYPFQNTSLSWDERVDDLISRLTVDEVIVQLQHGGDATNAPSPGIPRLGIQPWSWNTECLSGDVNLKKIFL